MLLKLRFWLLLPFFALLSHAYAGKPALAFSLEGVQFDLSTNDSFVGEIYSSKMLDGAGICSGTLVSPRLVLTAFHCLDDGDDNVATDIQFKTDQGELRNAEILMTAVEDRWPRHLNDEMLKSNEAFSAVQEDLALLVLEEPIEHTKPIPLKNIQELKQIPPYWTLIGFPDFRHYKLEPSSRYKSKAMRMASKERLSQAYGYGLPGTSGGAAISQSSQGPELIGTIVLNTKDTNAKIHMVSILIPSLYPKIYQAILDDNKNP